MRNLLLIAHFDTNNSYDCMSLTPLLKNQDSLILFNNQDLYYIYSNHIIQNHLHKTQLCEDSAVSILSLTKNIFNQYKYFIILQKTSIIINDLCCNFIHKSMQNNEIMDIIIDNNIVGVIVSKNYLTNSSLETTLYSFLNYKVKNPVIDISNYAKYIPRLVSQKIIKEYVSSPNVFFENNNCVFAIVGDSRTNNLQKSPCYINKQNNKIYNIDNNIIGEVLENHQDKLLIEWAINDTKKVIKYIKNARTNSYEELAII